MPRKKLIYTHEYPYHILARCNNKEWFHISLDDVWEIFVDEINILNSKFGFNIHAFVLMSNHYHLIATCSLNYNLGYIMRLLQSRTSRRINILSGRINHVYGSRYRASMITDIFYYAVALKYVFRNPVTAGIRNSVLDWKYSTIKSFLNEKQSSFYLSSHLFEKYIHSDCADTLSWLNQAFTEKDYTKIKLGLTRINFKIAQRDSPLNSLI